MLMVFILNDTLDQTRHQNKIRVNTFNTDYRKSSRNVDIAIISQSMAQQNSILYTKNKNISITSSPIHPIWRLVLKDELE